MIKKRKLKISLTNISVTVITTLLSVTRSNSDQFGKPVTECGAR
jgi:hypothetical protein